MLNTQTERFNAPYSGEKNKFTVGSIRALVEQGAVSVGTTNNELAYGILSNYRYEEPPIYSAEQKGQLLIAAQAALQGFDCILKVTDRDYSQFITSAEFGKPQINIGAGSHFLQKTFLGEIFATENVQLTTGDIDEIALLTLVEHERGHAVVERMNRERKMPVVPDPELDTFTDRMSLENERVATGFERAALQRALAEKGVGNNVIASIMKRLQLEDARMMQQLNGLLFATQSKGLGLEALGRRINLLRIHLLSKNREDLERKLPRGFGSSLWGYCKPLALEQLREHVPQYFL